MIPEITHLDFETFSNAGYKFDFLNKKFITASIDTGSTKRGLGLVGAWVYAEHPSTEVLTCSFTLPDGTRYRWSPGHPNPTNLFTAVLSGAGALYAANSLFEYCIWNWVCREKYGWPPLPLSRTFDVLGAALANGLPGNLEHAVKAARLPVEKDIKGNALMRKLSCPRNPTKNNPDVRIYRENNDEWLRLDKYCDQDVIAEIALANSLIPLSPLEKEVWYLDQKVNCRGVGVDVELARKCYGLYELAKEDGNAQATTLTRGAVSSLSQNRVLLEFLQKNLANAHLPKLKSLEKKSLKKYYDTHEGQLPALAKDLIKLRQTFSGSAPSKIPTLLAHTAKDRRVHGVYQFCGAPRTKRFAGRGPQPQNFPSGGPAYKTCPHCGLYQNHKNKNCVNCATDLTEIRSSEWDHLATEQAIKAVHNSTYTELRRIWGDVVTLISGILRALFIPGRDYVYLNSDFSSIEGVIMACVAGEQWVIDVFFGDGKLYEHTASKMFNVPVEELLEHKKKTGAHHSLRKPGKVAVLASQYNGSLGAWLNFGADKFLSNKEIRDNVKKWRNANPSVVHVWNATETAAINAILYPGQRQDVYQMSGRFSGVSYEKSGPHLFCLLPGDNWLIYRNVRLKDKKALNGRGFTILQVCEDYQREKNPAQELEIQNLTEEVPNLYRDLYFAKFDPIKAKNILLRYYYQCQKTIYYEGVTNGRLVELDTYGGKLCENWTQAIARNYQAEAMLRVENAGFPIVLHTHDEITAEVLGSDVKGREEEIIQTFEALMSQPPTWARLPDGRAWPVKAAGGWVRKRYGK